MSDTPLLRDDNQGIAFLTLNRPKVYNALSIELVSSLTEQLKSIERDTRIKVVVIGANGKGFSGGHDLKEMMTLADREQIHAAFTQCAAMMRRILDLPQPVIAKVQGMATAGGCQLVATCDLAIASSTATFATSGINLGLFCSTPMVAVSRVVTRKAALEMLLTGETLDADRALEIGLINRVVPPNELDQAVIRLAETLTSKPFDVLALGKKAFNAQIDRPIDTAYEYCCNVITDNFLNPSAQEGISAFFEKRLPAWPT